MEKYRLLAFPPGGQVIGSFFPLLFIRVGIIRIKRKNTEENSQGQQERHIFPEMEESFRDKEVIGWRSRQYVFDGFEDRIGRKEEREDNRDKERNSQPQKKECFMWLS